MDSTIYSVLNRLRYVNFAEDVLGIDHGPKKFLLKLKVETLTSGIGIQYAQGADWK